MIGLLCLAVTLAPAPSPAPPMAAIDPGARVRLTFAEDADPLAPGRGTTRRAGRVIAVGDRTVTVAFDDHSRPVEFDQASILGLERSLGGPSRGKRAARGAGIGLLAGLVSGVLLGVASGDDQCNQETDYLNFCNLAFSRGEKATIYGIALGAVGTMGGAVVGASGSGERWERGAIVFAKGRVGVHVVPAGRRGAGMAVSLGF